MTAAALSNFLPSTMYVGHQNVFISPKEETRPKNIGDYFIIEFLIRHTLINPKILLNFVIEIFRERKKWNVFHGKLSGVILNEQ